MYKVLLVDDEAWSLEGLSRLFEWEKMGFTVTAQTTDASEAFDIICGMNPDVVVTDIRMPEISGIELLIMSRKKGFKGEFVIISGFAEFEYAQEALRYGAFDYQLKPIDPDEAKLLLHKLIIHLEEKQFVRSMDILRELTSGCNNPIDIFLTKDYVPSGDYWQVVTISGESDINNSEISHAFSNLNHLALQISKTKTTIIMNGTRSLEHEVWTIIQGWAMQNHLRVGLSTVSEDISNLPTLIREADMAAANYFITAHSGISRFKTRSSFRIEGVIRKTEKWIMLKNYTEICSILDSIPDTFRLGDLGIYHVTCLWNQFAVIIRKRLENDHSLMNKIDFLDYAEIVNRFKNLKELCLFIREVIKEVCFPMEAGTAKPNNYNGNFIALLEHINENYHKELSLSELSERFFLNMTYCSELFKKVTGYTFSDYVSKLRMDAAMELLESGKYTADNVCKMTGYNDYYYFSKIFKKFHGLTPSQLSGRNMKSSSPEMLGK
ncbi:MAG: two component transcriptional regulator, AraC family [Paenibacillus sp.]|jgi:YesN/AraC family two-component response regulator|nr:two component transcriptional regulator, AraC family [Paenibacillus sp.]